MRSLLLGLLLLLNTISLRQCQQTSCESMCEEHDTMKAYEKCIRRCMNYDDLDSVSSAPPAHVANKTYPKPPSDAMVVFNVHRDYASKYLTATVHWNADADINREGFYMIFTAKSEACEQKFPGYFMQKIPATARTWEIPTQTLDLHQLTLNFGCKYRLEMRSEPYIYGDPNYTFITMVQVPMCIDGYCSCSTQPRVPRPEIKAVLPFYDSNEQVFKVLLSWQFHWPKDQPNVRLEFHVRLGDLIRSSAVIPWKNVYRFRPNDLTVPAQEDQTNYEAVLFGLKNQSQYRVHVSHGTRLSNRLRMSFKIFALSQHMCRSKEAVYEFTITDEASLDKYNHTEEEEQSKSDNITTISPSTQTSTHEPEMNIEANDTVDIMTSTITVNMDGQSYQYMMSVLPVCVVVLLILVGIGCHLRKSKGMKRLQFKDQFFRPPNVHPFSIDRMTESLMETNILYTEKEICDAQRHGLADHFEISYERLSYGRVIGQGAFGLVYIGLANAIHGRPGQFTVAIKQIKANASEEERAEFRQEIDTMKLAGNHPNIVQLYGCVTLQHPYCMVMEYIPYGDLLHYLKIVRKEYEDPLKLLSPYLSDDATNSYPNEENNSVERRIFSDNPFSKDGDSNLPQLSYSLDPAELQNFALQIANGMAHLEALNITHRDLAARNVLVGHGKCLKISDFGLSRSGIYVKMTSGRVPLRWLSLEAMQEQKYSTKSDVWAYGVVLWEICTLGGFPYRNIADKEVVYFLESGKRLEKPPSCSDAIYDLMLQCWSAKPEERPTFSRVIEMLTEMTQDNRMYVDFYVSLDETQPLEEYCNLLGHRKSSKLATIQ